MRDYRLWITLLRSAVGCAWLFEAYPQVAATGSYLSSGFNTAVTGMAAGNPWRFYRQFLEGVVMTHAAVFSYLTLVGNVLVGLCLLLGFLTPYTALIAIVLNVNYALAGGWMNRPIYPLNGLLIVCEILILALGAGKVAGVDAIFGGSSPRPRSRRY